MQILKISRKIGHASALLAFIVLGSRFVYSANSWLDQESIDNADTQNKVNQEHFYEIDKANNEPGEFVMGAKAYASECAFIKGAEPPKNYVEQKEMDEAATKQDFVGCTLWLARHSPRPKGYEAPMGLSPKEEKMTPQERILGCRAWALQVMAKQRRIGDKCKLLAEGKPLPPPDKSGWGQTVTQSTGTAKTTAIEDGTTNDVAASTDSVDTQKAEKKEKLKALGKTLTHVLGY